MSSLYVQQPTLNYANSIQNDIREQIRNHTSTVNMSHVNMFSQPVAQAPQPIQVIRPHVNTTFRGAVVTKEYPTVLLSHVHHILTNRDHRARETLNDAKIDYQRFIEKDIFFGEDKPTSHYRADWFVPSNDHWAEQPDVGEIGSLLLYNMRTDCQTTWQDALLSPDPEHRRQWQSKFPGVLHLPTEQLSFDLVFQMRNKDSGTVLSPGQLVGAFSGDVLGHCDLSLGFNEINQLLMTPQIDRQEKIVPHSIEIVDVNSNLPMPVSLQLRTDNQNNMKTEWFRCSTVTSNGVVGPVISPSAKGWTPTEVFEISPVARQAMFFRWINTPRNKVVASLSLNGDYYYLDTPGLYTDVPVVYHELWDGKSVPEDLSELYAFEDVKHISDPKPSIYMPPRDGIHVDNLASFIALDEWARIEKIRQAQNRPETDAYYNNEIKKFIVHRSIFDPLINEKFQGPMDPTQHVMEIDKGVTLRVSLLNPTAPGKKELADQLTGKKKTDDAPDFTFSVTVRVKCARLESGTVHKQMVLSHSI